MLTRFTLILVLILCFTMIARVAAQDDSLELFVPYLESGDGFDDTFEDGIYSHLYWFFGSEGDVVSIAMTQYDDALDPYLILLGANGEVYTTDDDSGEEFASALISNFELPEDGVYFVIATTASEIGFGVGSFTDGNDFPDLDFGIDLFGANPPDDFEATFSHEDFSIGDTDTVSITVDAPVVYATFEAEAGDVVNIITSSVDGNEKDTLLYVYDADGYRIAANDDADSLFAEIDSLEIPQDGVYIVFATSFDFYRASEDDWEGAGDFDLKIH
jgi:hypothetical protein